MECLLVHSLEVIISSCKVFFNHKFFSRILFSRDAMGGFESQIFPSYQTVVEISRSFQDIRLSLSNHRNVFNLWKALTVYRYANMFFHD